MSLHKEFLIVQPRDHFWVDIYHLMNSIVQPRPIAWISSVSGGGVHNLSPFSYFNICSMNPPIVSNSIFFNRDGSEKDTLRNIKATRNYVVGVVSHEAAPKANITAAPFAPEVDEFVEAGVQFLDRGPGLPRFIAESPVQLVCELRQTVSLGEGAGVGTLVLGDVREIHLSKGINPDGWRKGIPPRVLDNVGRMGADYYARTTEVFQMERPVVKK